MLDDPRIKRILKRYPKGENNSDASMDLSSLGDSYLLLAFRCVGETSLQRPIELDDYAITYLSRLLGVDFETAKFDHFLHSYVKSEFVSSFYSDASAVAKPPPENGPPAKIPIPPGMRWRSVRPKDGEERYEAWEFLEDKKEQ
jgi:hypothetical protein